MNEIINKFSLAGDKFMPQMHLRQHRSFYSTYRLFTKDRKLIKKLKETGDSK